MRPSAILSALKSFRDKHNIFTNKPNDWEFAKKCIQAHVDARNMESKRQVKVAEVRSGLHTGPVDPNPHYTVDFLKEDGTHVTSQHVYVPSST
ncbi:uncharacterized protein ARMOST_18396 [Armillaria ostoyae]|uniref:Uncharacterized protein n=1 Tax=Armillaria ostoyae TaxID=47428 RepID=A0A284S1M9_ARMOS|nr:uncharacterized protein ARMOST_18396 [Armillaria ostoyae]